MTAQSPIEWAHAFLQAKVERTPEARIVFRGRAGFAFSDFIRGNSNSVQAYLGGVS